MPRQLVIQGRENLIREIQKGQSEKDFQADVIAYAKARGWLVYHTHDSRRSPEGFPDLVMVRSGVLVFVELKSGKGKVTQEQAEWLCALGETPAIVGVWRPEDWLDVEKVLA